LWRKKENTEDSPEIRAVGRISRVVLLAYCRKRDSAGAGLSNRKKYDAL
jgi:hypothetical protein